MSGAEGAQKDSVVMIQSEPEPGAFLPIGRDWVWVVYRNRYPRQRRGFIKSIFGIGNEYNRIASFADQDRAVEYGLDIAEPNEKVVLAKEEGGQITVREPGDTND